MELSMWVEQRGFAEVSEIIQGALHTIDQNEEFIKLTLAVLMSPERVRQCRIQCTRILDSL